MTQKEPDILGKPEQLARTAEHVITVQVHARSQKEKKLLHVWQFPLLLCQAHSFPDRRAVSNPPNRSHSVQWKCHQTVCIRASTLTVWHSLSMPFSKLCYMWTECVHCVSTANVSEDIHSDSHHLHSQLSLRKPLTHTQTIPQCQKLLRLGTGGS